MNDDRMKELLRRAIAPVDVEPKRDLWYDMRRRIDERTLRLTWLDWALLVATLTFCAAFPESILPLLYHL
ncbi:MAG TPA: hypothetical protein VEZ11_09340 [Thermoanaerobaculia bacterium]|nr:hypothetical protein [Thermoanaerobaculia bacterium]